MQLSGKAPGPRRRVSGPPFPSEFESGRGIFALGDWMTQAGDKSVRPHLTKGLHARGLGTSRSIPNFLKFIKDDSPAAQVLVSRLVELGSGDMATQEGDRGSFVTRRQAEFILDGQYEFYIDTNEVAVAGSPNQHTTLHYVRVPREGTDKESTSEQNQMNATREDLINAPGVHRIPDKLMQAIYKENFGIDAYESDILGTKVEQFEWARAADKEDTEMRRAEADDRSYFKSQLTDTLKRFAMDIYGPYLNDPKTDAYYNELLSQFDAIVASVPLKAEYGIHGSNYWEERQRFPMRDEIDEYFADDQNVIASFAALGYTVKEEQQLLSTGPWWDQEITEVEKPPHDPHVWDKRED